MAELDQQLGSLCCECSDPFEPGEPYVIDPNNPECRLHPVCLREREENT